MPDRDVSRLYTASPPEPDHIPGFSVNGAVVKPVYGGGYASIARTWKKGDTIRFALPMPVQRLRASDKIAATVGKVALRYGPLIYNIEQIDQDINGVLSPSAPLRTEWRGDLLGGVTVIKGVFTNGEPMTAIPNFARYNRNPPEPPPAPPVPRLPAPPATSVVWIREQ
jgi:DUF1680 family protein